MIYVVIKINLCPWLVECCCVSPLNSNFFADAFCISELEDGRFPWWTLTEILTSLDRIAGYETVHVWSGTCIAQFMAASPVIHTLQLHVCLAGNITVMFKLTNSEEVYNTAPYVIKTLLLDLWFMSTFSNKGSVTGVLTCKSE